MSKNKKPGTLVGLGISMDFTDNAMEDDKHRSGVLRILVAGRAEWSIDWTISTTPAGDICQIGSGDKAIQLCDKTKETEMELAAFIHIFAIMNWDNISRTHGSRNGKCTLLATWKAENASIWYSTYDLEEKMIAEIIELCERTCRFRTEPSSGEPD